MSKRRRGRGEAEAEAELVKILNTFDTNMILITDGQKNAMHSSTLPIFA